MKEEELLQTQLDRFRKKYSFSYHKINTSQAGEKLNEQIHQYLANDLNLAAEISLVAAETIKFEGKNYRKDIGRDLAALQQ